MYTKHHLLVSLVIGVAVVAIAPPPISPLLVVAAAVVVGVSIDLDHFLLARYNAGDWRALRESAADPRPLLFEQDAVFEDGEVGAVPRLVTHLLLTAALILLALPLVPYLAVVIGVVLFAHVVADVVWDFTGLLGPAHARTG
ncbi:MAG: hypothetical protein ABEJ31_07430 [Haloarculaceae archaeon]